MSADKQIFLRSLKRVKNTMLLTTGRCCSHASASNPRAFLVSKINKHLALDSILADCQHGFRSQRSCETQLVHFVHDIISNLDRL